MKRILSLMLSVVMLAVTFGAFGINSYAADVKFDEQHQQYNSQNCYFNYSGDTFLQYRYGEISEDSFVYSSKSFKKRGKRIINSINETSLAVKGKYIYYVDSYEGAIKRCNLKGKKPKTIVKYNSDRYSINFIISKNRLVYNLIQYGGSPDGIALTKLYTCNLKGKNVKRIAKNVKTSFYTYKNKLYYVKGKSIFRYDFKENKSKRIYVGMPMKGAQVISMEDNILYAGFYTDEDEFEMDFYAIDITEFKFRRLERVKVDAPIHSIIASRDKFYITTGTGGGNSFARVVNEKADYKTYEKKYNLVTENVGFCKNSIILESSDFARFSDNTYKAIVVNK